MDRDVHERGPLSPIGFWLGLVLFILFFLVPASDGGSALPPKARYVAAVTMLCVTWWATRAVPLPVTSLVPLVMFPVLGVSGTTETARTYMHDVIVLLMGGLFLGETIRRSGLGHRLASMFLGVTGTRPGGMVLGFMVAAAILSMGLPAAVTCLLLLPVGMSLVERARQAGAFAPALMLGTAYGAILGSVATPAGSSPNPLFLEYFAGRYPEAPPVTVASWILQTLPLVLVLLPLAWLILTKIVCRTPGDFSLEELETSPGPMGSRERRVLAVTGITALLIAFRPTLVPILHRLQVIPVEATPGDFILDGTVMIFMALLLFIIRTGEGKGECLLDWRGAAGIPWGVLILFGGGLALAGGFETSGLARWTASQVEILRSLPPFVLVLSVCLGVTFLTEVTWSRGIPVILMPVLADLARWTNLNPLVLMMPAAISSAFAFLLPVGSASLAVTFASGRVSIARMVRAGLVLNLVAVLVVTAYVYLYLVGVLGMSVETPDWAPR